MTEVLQIPYEIQIVLVSGYLAYKIASVGKVKHYRPEDFVLQILAFGLIARSASLFVSGYTENYVASAAGSIVSAVLVAALWRSFLQRFSISAIQWLGVHRDDYEFSAWSSLISNRASWTFIQVHLSDGRTIESVFAAVPKDKIPGAPITLNDDGILLYITATYSPSGERSEKPVAGNDQDFIISFIPKEDIRQVEVGWKR